MRHPFPSHEPALRFRTPRAAACLIALLVLQAVVYMSFAGTGGRGPNRGTVALSVGARARAWARVEAETSPARLLLTRADVARGWVDVPVPARLSVRTNSSVGYTLRVRLSSGWVGIAELPDLPGRPVFAGDGGDWDRELPGPAAEDLTLAWRFHLEPGTRPGSHPWPITLEAHPR